VLSVYGEGLRGESVIERGLEGVGFELGGGEDGLCYL